MRLGSLVLGMFKKHDYETTGQVPCFILITSLALTRLTYWKRPMGVHGAIGVVVDLGVAYYSYKSIFITNHTN